MIRKRMVDRSPGHTLYTPTYCAYMFISCLMSYCWIQLDLIYRTFTIYAKSAYRYTIYTKTLWTENSFEGCPW